MAGKKESFLLVSLNEDKTKDLAQAVSNDSCRKILDYLAEHEATESDIAKELKVPISTVHYNLQQLIKGGLVVVEEFHYSEKGKEVNHYKLANKYIIIAPKSTWGLKEKLRSVLPIAAITMMAAIALEFAGKLFMRSGGSLFAAKSVAADFAMEEAVAAAPEMMRTAVEDTVLQTVAASPSIWQNTALWFLIGGVFAIVAFLVYDWMKRR
ncbi:MAG: helix-turn-helix domain-containing protein [archaeon]